MVSNTKLRWIVRRSRKLSVVSAVWTPSTHYSDFSYFRCATPSTRWVDVQKINKHPCMVWRLERGRGNTQSCPRFKLHMATEFIKPGRGRLVIAPLRSCAK